MNYKSKREGYKSNYFTGNTPIEIYEIYAEEPGRAYWGIKLTDQDIFLRCSIGIYRKSSWTSNKMKMCLFDSFEHAQEFLDDKIKLAKK